MNLHFVFSQIYHPTNKNRDLRKNIHSIFNTNSFKQLIIKNLIYFSNLLIQSQHAQPPADGRADKQYGYNNQHKSDRTQ